MPHSSGGGSHSGGSHSGSGFSSSSSSSGGSSAKHIKHTSFPGARRYVYYENYHPVYVYADYDIRKGTASGKFFSILGSAVSLLFGIMLLAMCDDVLTKSVTNSFNDELQNNLTARTRYTVSSAISTSFDDLTPTVMKSKVNWTILFTSIAILAFVCLHACLMIGINPKARKYAKAKPCSDAAQEKACEYCGYTYVVDTCTECPHCGAPIPPEDQPGARFT